jgi:hypothetical protein
MRNLLKLAAVLLIVAVAFGCSSTNTSKSAPTTDAKSQTGEWPSGTIHFEEWQFMAMLAGNQGHGTLGYNGKTYKFKVTGMGAGGYADKNRTFTFETADLIDLDTRADRYYLGTYYPKQLPQLPATQYLLALADKDGNILQAGKTYKFSMPAKVPAKQFWSPIVYDIETLAFIYSPEQRAGLSTFDLPNMKKNQDGSVTMYLGPTAPEGLESNWIPFRNFAVDGDVMPALESLKKHMRIYPLSEAGKEHGEVPNKNGSFVQLNTVPPNTYVFYEYLATLVQEEPAGSFGPEITGQMAAIGIEKEKKFAPDARMKKILTESGDWLRQGVPQSGQPQWCGPAE